MNYIHMRQMFQSIVAICSHYKAWLVLCEASKSLHSGRWQWSANMMATMHFQMYDR